jgi:catechol 2,3-dioxygenase-like lactoylglutathione lyase family enzyme
LKQKLSIMQSSIKEETDHTWYMRPVFFVTDIQRAVGFYVNKLGFTKKWHEEDGKGTVCQVDRGGCEIILCEDATRNDRGRVFLELSRKGVDQLLREIEERSIMTQKSWWGYDVLRLEDPDGNELLVCLEDLL